MLSDNRRTGIHKLRAKFELSKSQIFICNAIH